MGWNPDSIPDPLRARAGLPPRRKGRPRIIHGVALPTEEDEQRALFAWIQSMTPARPALALAFHPANGELRSKATAGRLKAMGVRPGVPDFLLPVPVVGYVGLAIEMKRVKGGVVSKSQQWWLDNLRSNGWRAEVCAGFLEAQAVILDYLR